jgi:hypothetical protein
MPPLPPVRSRRLLSTRTVIILGLVSLAVGFLLTSAFMGEGWGRRTIDGIDCITGPNGAVDCNWGDQR